VNTFSIQRSRRRRCRCCCCSWCCFRSRRRWRRRRSCCGSCCGRSCFNSHCRRRSIRQSRTHEVSVWESELISEIIVGVERDRNLFVVVVDRHGVQAAVEPLGVQIAGHFWRWDAAWKEKRFKFKFSLLLFCL
jgi:hypothetical protein